MIRSNEDESDIRTRPNAPQRGTPYKFTQEEVRVLKECNRESFYKRCLPLGTILGFATYYGVQAGYLKPSKRLGASPKVIVAVIGGYFLGKFSYQSKCAEKLMQLPNSAIGEMLRQRRRGNIQESLDTNFGAGMSLAPFSGISSSEMYSDAGEPPRPGFDIDTSRPQYDGLDDSHRPSLDNPIYEEEMPPVQKHYTTYEELRRKNREEYQQKRTGSLKEPLKPSPPAPAALETIPDVSSAEPESPKIGHRNKYGDVWE